MHKPPIPRDKPPKAGCPEEPITFAEILFVVLIALAYGAIEVTNSLA
jgi:hypothetical protein